MAVVGIEFSEAEKEWLNKNEGKVIILKKDVTVSDSRGKYHTVVAGSNSLRYSSCYYSFLADDKTEVNINISTVYKNIDVYFEVL